MSEPKTQSYTGSLLGVKVSLQMYDLQSMIAAVGEIAVWQMCCAIITYRKTFPEIREKLAERLSAELDIPIPVDADGIPTVSEKKFVDKLEADGKVTKARIAEIVRELVNDLGVISPVSPVRETKIPKAALDTADQLLAAIARGDRTMDDFIESFESKNPGYEFEQLPGADDRERVARAYVINHRRIAEENKIKGAI